jgi:hypothetical protein
MAVVAQHEALVIAGIDEKTASKLLASVKTDSRVKSELKKNTDRAVATGM